jgi:hypothetical protein
MEENLLPKTPEELKAEKIAAFNTNPDTFIALEDVILGALRGPSGIMICVGRTNRSTLEIALSRVNFRAFQTFIGMDIASQEEAKNILIPGGNGKHGIFDFVRGRKK